jgi:hypothetical protein
MVFALKLKCLNKRKQKLTSANKGDIVVHVADNDLEKTNEKVFSQKLTMVKRYSMIIKCLIEP